MRAHAIPDADGLAESQERPPAEVQEILLRKGYGYVKDVDKLKTKGVL